MLRLALSPPSSRLAFFNPSRRSLVANQASLGRKTSSLEVIAHRRLLLPCPLAIGLEGRALLSRKMTTRTDNARLTVATVGRLEGGKKIGDPKLPIKTRPDEFCRTEFHSESNPEAVDFVARRIQKYEEIKQRREAEAANTVDYPREEIDVEIVGKGLNGVRVKGTSWMTRPVELGKLLQDEAAVKAMKDILKNAVVAKVYPTEKPRGKQIKMADSSGLDDEAEKDHSQDVKALTEAAKGQLWDMLRPLEGSCKVEFLDFDDNEGRMVFWHSSAHVLGECLECGYGCQLTVGPPVKTGFFYDAYMGEKTVDEEFKRDIEKKAKMVCQMESPPEKGQKQSQIGQKFERLVVTKEEALELFGSNPFKVAMISAKVPDGSYTTVYRCGPMIDLCMGPHIPNTRAIKGFAVLQASQANFLGKAENDSLQRVYGVSFPDEKRLDAHLQNLKEAKDNDHRVRGKEQELFFFHQLSPGSAFFEPAGARIYNRLMEFIRTEYRQRGYQEVITPNIYNVELWKTSGHWEHYAKNMFSFTDGEEKDHGHDHHAGCDHGHGDEEPAVDESQLDEAAKRKLADKRREAERRREMSTFALKPMNCPGHCLMFANRDRSYRELPLRMADFGVLHRNELSGALTGLTRVRRFQQDDAHIFCQRDQIKQEVLGALNFMKHVYETFGMTYKLERSTRPAKANGLDTPEGVALWDDAEQQLADAMNEFSGVGTWRDNPGDGAFYGPKIDIKVFDAQGRMHQCATVQLDFQMPIRFNLDYVSKEQKRERPVMVHRAMLGSVERFIAILTEHFRGRWPFWLSPRQAMVVPMLAGSEEDNKAAVAYAHEVAVALREFYVELPNSANDHHNEAIKKAFDLGTKFCLCIGPSEVRTRSVSVEGRQPYGSTAKGPVHFGVCTLDELVLWFRAMQRERSLDENALKVPEAPAFKKQSYEKGQNKKGKGGGDAAPKGAEASGAAAVASPAKPAKQAGGAEPAPKRRQEELKQTAQEPLDRFYVGDDSYPTAVPQLKGKRFANMEEFLVALKKTEQ